MTVAVTVTATIAVTVTVFYAFPFPYLFNKFRWPTLPKHSTNSTHTQHDKERE